MAIDEPYAKFDLTTRFLLFGFEEFIFPRWDLDPIHPYHLKRTELESTEKKHTHYKLTFVSIIKRRIYGILLSYVETSPLNKSLYRHSPLSNTRMNPNTTMSIVRSWTQTNETRLISNFRNMPHLRHHNLRKRYGFISPIIQQCPPFHKLYMSNDTSTRVRLRNQDFKKKKKVKC